jgi:hypothetical protein
LREYEDVFVARFYAFGKGNPEFKDGKLTRQVLGKTYTPTQAQK